MTRPPGRPLSNPGRDSGVRRQTSPGSEDRELESDSAPLLGGASTSKRSTFRFRSSTEVGPFPPLNTGAQSPPCDGGRTGSPRPALRDLIPGFLTPSARPASGRRMPSSIPLSVRDFFANAWNYQQLSPDSETLFTYTPDERQSFRSRRGTAPMSIFRSEEMSLVQVYIPLEIAQATFAELGECGMIQFRDLDSQTTEFMRPFVTEIRRLEEMERKMRFLESQLAKAEVPPREVLDKTPYAKFRTAKLIDELEAHLNEHDAKVSEMNTYQETLNKRMLELTELRHVLREASTFFADTSLARRGTAASIPELDPERAEEGTADASASGQAAVLSRLECVAGVIPVEKMSVFERILWRVLRGNLFMNSTPIDELIRDPVTGEVTKKNVFIIFAQGKHLLGKIRKIADSMGATLYPVERNPFKRRQDASETAARIQDLNNVLYNTNQTRMVELRSIVENIASWDLIVKKEKAIYYAMNTCSYDQGRRTLLAEGWIPTASVPEVQSSLRAAATQTGSTVSPILSEIPTNRKPPTFFRTNKFTAGFQTIVDSYGVARYGEVNPGLFTIITFPFLFAVMFGDLGHGAILTLIGLALTVFEARLEKYKSDEMFSMIYGGRYIILLMGFWSMYVGLVYNDIFSLGLDIFNGMQWEFWGEHQQRGYQTGVYAFGVDPAWAHASNKLLFVNSYKMKQAILLGVVHMTFGICLQLWNHRHFKKPLNIWAEFVPQLLFFESIFGYLGILIVTKWCTDWYSEGLPPPNLLNTLIYMFLSPGKVEPDSQIYSGQSGVQIFLLMLALVCVPWMLIPKPLILNAEHKASGKKAHDEGPDEEHGTFHEDTEALLGEGSPAAAAAAHSSGGGGGGHDDEEFDFGEIVIHQVIHTIEFCLGAVSNTASYLRLWALSLAHAQLSEVLYTMTLNAMFTLEVDPMYKAIAIALGFAVWFILTVGILLVMEGLSAFLHALRLHWVEFQNKFYEGSGRMFQPFAFSKIEDGDMESVVVPDL